MTIYIFISRNTKDIHFDVPQYELSVPSEFYEVSDPIYHDQGEGILTFTIKPTEKGEKYLKTKLYALEYHIQVSVMNSETEQLYYTSDEMIWNADEKKIFNWI